MNEIASSLPLLATTSVFNAKIYIRKTRPFVSLRMTTRGRAAIVRAYGTTPLQRRLQRFSISLVGIAGHIEHEHFGEAALWKNGIHSAQRLAGAALDAGEPVNVRPVINKPYGQPGAEIDTGAAADTDITVNHHKQNPQQ